MKGSKDIAFTVKSQPSAMDYYSKKENSFLERYARYVIKDECNKYLTDNHIQMIHVLDAKKVTHDELIQSKTKQVNVNMQQNQNLIFTQNQQTEINVFFAIRDFSFSSFAHYYNKILDLYNIYAREDKMRTIRTQAQENQGKERQKLFFQQVVYSDNEESNDQKQGNFFEIYSNKVASDHNNIAQGEIVIVDCRIKCTPQKAKQILYETRKKIEVLFNSQVKFYFKPQKNYYFKKIQHQIIESEYLEYLRFYKMNHITVIIFYNGDVNFDFQKYLPLNQITIQGVRYYVKLKVYFVSKHSLFLHFRETNSQQKIEQITDKVYNLTQLKNYLQKQLILYLFLFKLEQIVTFYDMKRIGNNRANIVNEIERIKQERKQSMQIEQSKKKQKQILTASVVGFACLVGGLFLIKKKKFI